MGIFAGWICAGWVWVEWKGAIEVEVEVEGNERPSGWSMDVANEG